MDHQSLTPNDVIIPAASAAFETLDGRTMAATPSGKLLSFGQESAPDEINPTAEAALSLADGTRSLAEIAHLIASVFDVSEDTALNDLTDFFETLVASGAFEIDRRRES